MPALRPLLSVVLIVAVVAVRPSSAAPSLRYRPPVAGRLLAPFAAPTTPYGAGHRGVDLATPAGGTVRAAAGGVVAFAGPVAGAEWVAIAHPDGVRTSYGPMASVAVARGGTVAAGEPIGRAVGTAHPGRSGLHWGARRDGAYIDPMELLDQVPWRPALVGPGGWDPGPRPADAPRYEPWSGRHRWGLVPSSPHAAGPGWITAPNPHHVVGIAGLGSEHGDVPLELTHLGYDEADVSYLSYAGTDAHGTPRPYGPPDTWEGVHRAALRLRDHLRRRRRQAPGQAVDLVGHSMGGVVALHYLLALHDPTDPGLPPIANVVTIASPLEGADLAALLLRTRRDLLGRALTDAAGAVVTAHDPDGQAIVDLAPGSPLLRDLVAAWEAATAAPARSALATGTRVMTFGGSRDLIVPEHRSDLPRADHVVLPGGHDAVRGTEAARIAVRAFLAGEPVPGEAGGLGHLLSHSVGHVDEVAALSPWFP